MWEGWKAHFVFYLFLHKTFSKLTHLFIKAKNVTIFTQRTAQIGGDGGNIFLLISQTKRGIDNVRYG